MLRRLLPRSIRALRRVSDSRSENGGGWLLLGECWKRWLWLRLCERLGMMWLRGLAVVGTGHLGVRVCIRLGVLVCIRLGVLVCIRLGLRVCIRVGHPGRLCPLLMRVPVRVRIRG